ncbi:MAG: hypothetical protein NTZ69_13220 [Bacteroidia bacterium]|nr:hypothetical protein [Bacteroidia bacterium]
MRKIILLTVLIIGYCLPTFSQSNSQLQFDTTTVKFGFFNGSKTLGHLDTIDFKQLLNNPEHHKYLLDPKLADKDVHFGQLSNGRIKASHSLDNMPCLYPQGSFPMPICKPDSTVRYSLLIRKYK